MSSLKDTMGNTLEVGHQVTVMPPQNIIWVGSRIVEISEGDLPLGTANKEGLCLLKLEWFWILL